MAVKVYKSRKVKYNFGVVYEKINKIILFILIRLYYINIKFVRGGD